MTAFGIPEIDEKLAGVMRLMDQVGEFQERMSEVTSTATTEDERIAVTVGHGGRIRDLRIDPRALRMPSENLAEAIKDVIARAQDGVKGEVDALLGSLAETAGLDPAAFTARPDVLKASAEEVGQVARSGGSLNEMREAIASMTQNITGIRST